MDLASQAVQGGIYNDLGSGSNVDLTIITKDNVEVIRSYKSDNKKVYNKKKPFNLVPGQTR